MEDVRQQFKTLQVLVNNAGIALRRSFEQFTSDLDFITGEGIVVDGGLTLRAF